MIDLAPPGLLDHLVARQALGKTPPSVTKLSDRDTPPLNPSKDRRPFLPRPAKMIPVNQIAMVHDAGIDASATATLQHARAISHNSAGQCLGSLVQNVQGLRRDERPRKDRKTREIGPRRGSFW